MTCNYSITQRIGIIDPPEADQFPLGRLTDKIVGILTATSAYPILKFPGYTNFDVTLLYPNEVWSGQPEPGCLIGDWPESSQIEFYAYKDLESLWSNWKIYNPKKQNGLDFPVDRIRTTALGLVELLGSVTQPPVATSTTDPNLSWQEKHDRILALNIEERKKDCERHALELGHTITSWTLVKEGLCWGSNRCVDENCIATCWVSNHDVTAEEYRLVGGLALSVEHGHPYCLFSEGRHANIFPYRKGGEIRPHRLSR